MNKILRLARANLRRHKKESVLLGILVMLCMTLLFGAIAAERNIRQMFPDLMERTEAWDVRMYITEQEYDPMLRTLLREDDRVTDSTVYHYISSGSTRIPEENGKTKLYIITFMTEENERLFERYEPQTSLSEAEIAAMAHPIIVPLSQKKALSLNEGDSFTVINDSKRFTFTVAGFYESGYFTEPKFIVRDADYAVMKTLFNQFAEVACKVKNISDAEAVRTDLFSRCAEAGVATEHIGWSDFRSMQSEFNVEILFILRIIEVMACMILIAVTVMIGYSIVSDIRDQIVNIGVLEALGYRSREIARSYAAEYLIIALAGCAAGTLLGAVLQRVLIGIAENMKGCTAGHGISGAVLFILLAVVLLTVFLTAYMKARSVRKYPPVLAFRKGIQNHHFGKSHFPLRHTKGNVHLRLAMKGFADRARRQIGLTFVMSITSFAVVLSFILFLFLGRGSNVVKMIAGQEMADLQLSTVTGIDTDAFRAELEAMPGVRKVLPTTQTAEYSFHAVGHNTSLIAVVYPDYAETENILPCEGRLPRHENEVMVTKQTASMFRLRAGDTLTLEMNSVRRDYLITGIVTAVINATSVYMTEDGMRRIYPVYQPDSFLIYRSEDTDTETLRAELDRRFGKSAESLGSEESTAAADSYEARVRQRAEQIIASMIGQDGATNVEYAVRVGDQVITGGSREIKIQSFLNLPELLESLMEQISTAVSLTTRLFMGISALVVMMILWILMESEIRRQRRELGIMKGMGYTSKELMLQLAFRIMPAALLAVIIGTLLAVGATALLVSFIGNVPVNLPAVLLLDCCILGFCFGCAYLGAGKIRKISVYELMTE